MNHCFSVFFQPYRWVWTYELNNFTILMKYRYQWCLLIFNNLYIWFVCFVFKLSINARIIDMKFIYETNYNDYQMIGQWFLLITIEFGQQTLRKNVCHFEYVGWKISNVKWIICNIFFPVWVYLCEYMYSKIDEPSLLTCFYRFFG